MHPTCPSARVRWPLSGVVILLAASCADPVDPEPELIGLDVQAPPGRLETSATARLSATARYAGGAAFVRTLHQPRSRRADG